MSAPETLEWDLPDTVADDPEDTAEVVDNDVALGRLADTIPYLPEDVIIPHIADCGSLYGYNGPLE